MISKNIDASVTKDSPHNPTRAEREGGPIDSQASRSFGGVGGRRAAEASQTCRPMERAAAWPSRSMVEGSARVSRAACRTAWRDGSRSDIGELPDATPDAVETAGSRNPSSLGRQRD